MIGFAHAAEAGAAQPNPLFGLLPWVAVFAVFYFLVILPNKKREKARQEMISSLKKGDRVMLSSGFYGTRQRAGGGSGPQRHRRQSGRALRRSPGRITRAA